MINRDRKGRERDLKRERVRDKKVNGKDRKEEVVRGENKHWEQIKDAQISIKDLYEREQNSGKKRGKWRNVKNEKE